MKSRLILFAALCLAGMGNQVYGQKFTPISNFSLDKYLGTWYEIARLPAGFEKGLGHVTATYSLKPDGTVLVLNQGIKEKNGKPSSAKGKAKFGATSDLGYLRVSFFGPFYADYVIVDLDPEYRYALVVSGSFKYLWILCRKPTLDKSLADMLTSKAQNLGFDTKKLIWTKQEDAQ
jgi:apolipoprotein D and lipocalin family protein